MNASFSAFSSLRTSSSTLAAPGFPNSDAHACRHPYEAMAWCSIFCAAEIRAALMAGRSFEIGGEMLTLFHQPNRGFAFLRGDFGIECLENCLQFFHMSFRFLEVTLKMILQRLASRQLDQLGNCLDKLFFRIITVGQFGQE